MKMAQVAGALLLVFSVLSLSPAAVRAKKESHRQWCKRVREAIWAGHTLDQLTTEFNTDATQIVTCLPRGKGKKAKVSKPKAASADHAGKRP